MARRAGSTPTDLSPEGSSTLTRDPPDEEGTPHYNLDWFVRKMDELDTCVVEEEALAGWESVVVPLMAMVHDNIDVAAGREMSHTRLHDMAEFLRLKGKISLRNAVTRALVGAGVAAIQIWTNMLIGDFALQHGKEVFKIMVGL